MSSDISLSSSFLSPSYRNPLCSDPSILISNSTTTTVNQSSEMDSRSAFSDYSNDTSTCCQGPTLNDVLPEDSAQPDVTALLLLSDNLASVLVSDHCDFDFYADAKIVVTSNQEVALHRCILASRSPYFKSLFASSRQTDSSGGGVRIDLKDLARDFDVGYDALVTVLAYLYSGKVRAFGGHVCVCVDVECQHLGCRPAVDFLLQLLYLSFTFQIPELVSLYQRRLLEILDEIIPDDLLLVLYVANLCTSEGDILQARCVEMIVKSNVDNITLEKSLPTNIVELIMDARKEGDLMQFEGNSSPDIHAKRIYRALDSDDVELVIMLLKDGHTTINEAYALHYAVAYCDAKTSTELLKLGQADVNCINKRGLSVLHIAAMRKDPTIIASLLIKGGAQPTAVTGDGRKALQISRRLTRAADWDSQGKPSHPDRLCIEILEQAERREPMFLGEDSMTPASIRDLLYLESRVGLAKHLFPEEAKVAMQIAEVGGTTEFSLPKGTVEFLTKEEHLQRMTALAITVRLGKHFFPRCSQELDLLVDDEDLEELANKGNDTPEQIRKRQRFTDIQDSLMKAFKEDKKAQNMMPSIPKGKHPGRHSYKKFR